MGIPGVWKTCYFGQVIGPARPERGHLVKLVKLVVLVTGFFGAQSLGYLILCLLRGDAFFQLFGIWHSTEHLMWLTALLLLSPIMSGIAYLMTAEQRVAARNYNNDALLKRWIGLQIDGMLPKDSHPSRRIYVPKP
jgi:hypothetical protein